MSSNIFGYFFDCVNFIIIYMHLCIFRISVIDALKEEEFLNDFLGNYLLADPNYSASFNKL